MAPSVHVGKRSKVITPLRRIGQNWSHCNRLFLRNTTETEKIKLFSFIRLNPTAAAAAAVVVVVVVSSSSRATDAPFISFVVNYIKSYCCVLLSTSAHYKEGLRWLTTKDLPVYFVKDVNYVNHVTRNVKNATIGTSP
jgi:hypothetical protein